jgi:hypothetical protein
MKVSAVYADEACDHLDLVADDGTHLLSLHDQGGGRVQFQFPLGDTYELDAAAISALESFLLMTGAPNDVRVGAA